jgi:hypothetical protein
MSKIYFCLMILLCSLTVSAQQKPDGERFTGKVPEIICPAGTANTFTFVPPSPASLRRNPRQPNARTTGAGCDIVVTYNGFTPEAKAAFEYAVSIWENKISSPVKIYVRANWTELDKNVLGSASPTTFYRNFQGANRLNTWYVIALAEKMTGKDLNTSGEADIQAQFNSQFAWYYGTDGKTPAGKYDLVSVVLHELGHGLGFYGFWGVDSKTPPETAGWGLSGFPSSYDVYLENVTGKKLTDTSNYFNPSKSLLTQVTGDNVFFNSPLAKLSNNTPATEKRPKIYAPKTYSAGSSISHLDSKTYPAGDPNSLMTPSIDMAEADFEPGPIMLGIFAEMGWVHTYLIHQPVLNTENTTAPILFQLKVLSDTLLKKNAVKLHYITNTSGSETVVNMTAGAADTFTFSLPNPGSGRAVGYYLEATDTLGRKYTYPNEGKITVSGNNISGNFLGFEIGADTKPPVISFSPLPFIFADSTQLLLAAAVSDGIGVDTVFVEYRINGTTQPNLPLKRKGTGSVTADFYEGKFLFPKGSIKGGDTVFYRIVARDKAIARNTAFSPANGFYKLAVVSPAAPRDAYTNTFNTLPVNDFVGNSFSIRQPAGFANPAIHSDHPYQNGSDINFESNYIFQLLIPITLKAGDGRLSFDEIVLVEPGEPNAAFASPEFYDYVVTEGSADNGKTWIPFENGYDSRDNTDWLKLWESKTAPDPGTPSATNSTAVPTPAYFRTRLLDMLKVFKAGDVVQIRFRLFADQLTNGWGWAIDNLAIQASPLGIEDLLVENGKVLVYPNPSVDGRITVQADFRSTVSQADIEITDVLGNRIFKQNYKLQQGKMNRSVDLSRSTPGLYLVQIQAEGSRVTRKVFIR